MFGKVLPKNSRAIWGGMHVLIRRCFKCTRKLPKHCETRRNSLKAHACSLQWCKASCGCIPHEEHSGRSIDVAQHELPMHEGIRPLSSATIHQHCSKAANLVLERASLQGKTSMDRSTQATLSIYNTLIYVSHLQSIHTALLETSISLLNATTRVIVIEFGTIA